MKKILVILIVVIALAGCSNSNKEKSDNQFQTKIIENNYSYDYTQYKKIQETALSCEKALLDKHILIQSISFESSMYADDIYKTVIYTINSDSHITLKFDNNQNLMLTSLINLNNGCSDCKYALIDWGYWNFSSEDRSYITESSEEIITVNNFEIDSSSETFSITDTRY